MIEILSKSQVKDIEDEQLREYLEYSFARLPEDYLYPQYGHFVIIENYEELKSDYIQLSSNILNGIDNGLYENINMVELEGEILEILLFVNNDINISLIIPISIIENIHKERLLSYKI